MDYVRDPLMGVTDVIAYIRDVRYLSDAIRTS